MESSVPASADFRRRILENNTFAIVQGAMAYAPNKREIQAKTKGDSPMLKRIIFLFTGASN
jgi:hypothetical protein